MTSQQNPDQTIEMGRGATYRNTLYTVYEHSVYDDSSASYPRGYPRRQWLDDFETLADAKAAYPHAVVIEGSTYNPYAGGGEFADDDELNDDGLNEDLT